MPCQSSKKNLETETKPEHHTVVLMQTEAPTRDTIHQVFEPYRRISPPWTASERIKTLIMTIFILPLRILFLVFASIPIVILARIALIGKPAPSHTDRTNDNEEAVDYDSDPLFQQVSPWRRFLIQLASPIARCILFFSFGIFYIRMDKAPFSERVAHRQPKHGDKARAYVVVANHLGYIDILVLLATYKGSFVAKGECESTPVIGLCARALQCMFVRAGQPLTTQLVQRIRATYDCHKQREESGAGCRGCPTCLSKLVVFAEGTTTNGTLMIPFRTGVFNAGLPVQPVCVRFPYTRFNPTWETIRFREHIFRMMTQFRNRVHCTQLPVYIPSEEEQLDSRLFATNVQAEIANVLQQSIVPLNRKHKFLYHSYLLGRESDEAEVLIKAYDIFDKDEQLKHFIRTHVERKV